MMTDENETQLTNQAIESTIPGSGTGSGIRTRKFGRWALILVVVGGALGALWFLTQADSPTDDAAATTSLSFSEVVRTDLVEETEYDGTLGRPAGDSLLASAQGTVTALPAPGDTINQGDVVYAIDGQPVVLLYGGVPMYRTLSRSAEDIGVAARTPGTLTAVAAVGTVIEQGDVLFEVDDQPVIALYGEAPAYRRMSDLSTNIEGNDVLQLEEALDALGFVSAGEMTVDGEFTGATASVVEQWQAAVGAEEDGSVELGEVFFIPGPTEVSTATMSVGDTVGAGQSPLTLAGREAMVGDDVAQLETALVALGYGDGGALVADREFTEETAQAVKAFELDLGLKVDGRITPDEVLFVREAVRVSSTLAVLGGSVNPGSPVLAVTGEQTVVTMNLPAADQGTLTEGMSVSVELPDRTTVTGTVTSVATVATVSGNETVFEVEIELDDPTAATGLDEAPVDVNVVSDSVEGVMAVPVAALLALSEGGYAVEVDTGGGQTRLVAVDPGFFADGLVEIDSDGIQPGDMVVVP